MDTKQSLFHGWLLAGLLTAHVSGWAQTDSTGMQQSDNASHTQTLGTENRLSIGLNFMTHGEVRGGGLPGNANPDETVEKRANFLLGRTRLSVGYERGVLEARAVLQNQAVWGQKNNTTVNLYEGWAKLTAPFGLFAQIGRIALSYDDERIIGPNDWAMASRAHDLLRVGYQGHGHQVHALVAYNQNPENLTTGTYYKDGAQAYKTMQVVWYHYDVPKIPVGASLLFMNIGMQAGQKDNNAHTEYQQLVGGYLTFTPRRWKVEGSYYRQMGHNEEEGKIEAWMASGKVTYYPSAKVRLEAGYDYLSGDDYVAVPKPGTMGLPRHEVYKGFNTLYGSHHKFYGVMDYFYESAYSNGFTPGLQNAFVGVQYRPIAPLTVKAAYHYMAVATSLEGLDKTLGHDIELEAAYRFSKDVALSAGYSFMHGTKTMDRLKHEAGDSNVRWGWFSLIVSPRLFSTKW